MACPPLAATPKQPRHGLQRDHQPPQPGFRADQGGGSLLGVHLPLGHQSRGQLAHVVGIHHVGRNRRVTEPVGAVGPDLLQVHRQGIAGLGPLHVEGPGLRVASGRHLLAPVVDPPGVHRRGHQGIAIAHPQHRRMRPQGGVVPGGSEVVLHGLDSGSGRFRGSGASGRPPHPGRAFPPYARPARTQDSTALKDPIGSARTGVAPKAARSAQSPTGRAFRPAHRPAETNRC